MLNFWSKKKKDESQSLSNQSNQLTWDAAATQGLQQAMAQAPVPAMLKGRVKQELKTAAENEARAAGRTTVTAQDLMQGLLAKLPANMRSKVEEAMQGGPEKLQQLQKDLENNSSQ